MYNDISVIGHLGQDPVQHNTQNGSNFATFSVAVSKRTTKGEEKPPMWINVTCFKSAADFVGKYLKKGDRVLVQGELEIEQYSPKDTPTEKRTSVKILANRVISLSTKKDKEEDTSKPSVAAAADDNIPF
jgi:single-strand DNA-binding protein